VDGKDGKTNPFDLTKTDGKLFGRGTTDMMSFVVVILASLPGFQGRGLEVPAHVALSYDKEVGLVGVRRLIADMNKAGVRPKGCIAGEPMSMHIDTSHKGKRSYRCRVRGAAIRHLHREASTRSSMPA
jgi:acetylornithine deacetylase